MSKATKGAPMALRWLAAIRACGEIPPSDPGRVSVVAVAAILLSYGDADGRNCCPSLETIVREAGVSKRTARTVLGWLVTNGWLKLTAEAVQYHHAAVYRLTIPMGADEHRYEMRPMGAEQHPLDGELMGAPMGAPMGAEEHRDLIPPNVSEEEDECADAPSAGAPGAAHSPPPSQAAINACKAIGEHAGQSIKPSVLGPAIDAVMARTAHCWQVVAVYCVEKLKADKTIRDPSRFLRTDLSSFDRQTMPSPRMLLASKLHRLGQLDDQWDYERDPDDWDGMPSITVEAALVAAGLLGPDEGARDLLWLAKPSRLVQIIEIIGEVA